MFMIMQLFITVVLRIIMHLTKSKVCQQLFKAFKTQAAILPVLVK